MSSILHAFDRSTPGGFVRSLMGARNYLVSPVGCVPINWMDGATLICDKIFTFLYLDLINPAGPDAHTVASGIPMRYDAASNSWKLSTGPFFIGNNQITSVVLSYIAGIALTYTVANGQPITIPLASGQGCLGTATDLVFNGLMIGGVTYNAHIGNQCCVTSLQQAGYIPNTLYANICVPGVVGYTPIALTKDAGLNWVGSSGAISLIYSPASPTVVSRISYVESGVQYFIAEDGLQSICSTTSAVFALVKPGVSGLLDWRYGVIDVNDGTSLPCCPAALPSLLTATVRDSSGFYLPHPVTFPLFRGNPPASLSPPFATWFGGTPAFTNPAAGFVFYWPGQLPVYGRGYVGEVTAQAFYGVLPLLDVLTVNSFSMCSPLHLQFVNGSITVDVTL